MREQLFPLPRIVSHHEETIPDSVQGNREAAARSDHTHPVYVGQCPVHERPASHSPFDAAIAVRLSLPGLLAPVTSSGRGIRNRILLAHLSIVPWQFSPVNPDAVYPNGKVLSLSRCSPR